MLRPIARIRSRRHTKGTESRTKNKGKMKIPIQIKALVDLLEEYLPPHIIEEVRGRIFDIIGKIQ